MTNIVYLMADDLGFADLDPAYMPRSHALMESLGTQIDFQTAQNCTPTRTAFMTGKDPSRFDLHGVYSPPDFPGLPESEHLLSERMKDAGYATGIFGKWHLGLDEGQAPWNQGFDTSVGFLYGQVNSYGVQQDVDPYGDGSLGHDHHGGHDMLVDGTPIHSSQYSTFLFAEAASDFIAGHAAAEEEFFAYVPFNAPHGPYSAPREYVDLYVAELGVTQAQYDLLTVHADDVLAVPQTDLDLATGEVLTNLVYYAMVRAMDDAIADIYQSVVDAGVADETLFLFASDNGHRTHPYDVGDGGILQGGKGTPYEGGHRSANFIIWPEEIEVGATIDEDIWVGDLNPTFLSIAGGTAGTDLDGVDVSAVLRGEAFERPADKPIVPHIAKNDKVGSETSIFSVLFDDFKYIWKKTATDAVSEGEPSGIRVTEELYNLVNDLGETQNLLRDRDNAAFVLKGRALFDDYGYGGLKGEAYIDSLPAIGPTGWNGYEIPLEWGAPQITSYDDPGIILYGSNEAETFAGEPDADIIWGGGGNDILRALAGNDMLRGGNGADLIDGGAGFDTADYGGSLAGLRIDALRPLESTGEALGDTLIDIERIFGSLRDDAILGTQAADTLHGRGGNDVLIGRGGDDLLFGDGGDDLLIAGVGRESFDGGAGIDTVSYDRADGFVAVDLRNPDRSGGEASGDSFASIEMVVASRFDDTLSGNDAGETLAGREGNDTLYGRGGDDRLEGEEGDDALFGQAGKDTAVFSGARADYDITVSGGEAVILRGQERDTAIGVEALEFDDTVVFLDERALTITEAREVAYLYEAGLNRDGVIDAAGLNFWIDVREQALDIVGVSRLFLDSPEFATVNGTPDSLSDRALVEALYRNVLDRDGERGGIDFWVDSVAQPEFDRAQLLYAFANSPENIRESAFVRSLEQVELGTWDFPLA